MEYSQLVDLYLELEKTTKRLEKRDLLAKFLTSCADEDLEHLISLLQGKVFPHYDERKLGISSQLIIKIMAKAFGLSSEEVERTWKELGDLGEVGKKLSIRKKQTTLFSKKLQSKKVFDNLQQLALLEGKGTESKKIDLVSELLVNATSEEVRFIVRTVLEDLRIGVADGVLRDALAAAYHKEAHEIERAMDFLLDYGEVAYRAKHNELKNLGFRVGKPFRVMLCIKVDSVSEAFEAVGKPALFDYKLDGFRVVVHKKGKNVTLFTRRMENVTKQFAETLDTILKNVNCDSCILDTEFVGYDPKTKNYLPFQIISQRIRRKYDIEKIAKQFPVEINVFDIVYYNGKNLITMSQAERRKLIEKIVKGKKLDIAVTPGIITDDEKEVTSFFKKAISLGYEGLVAKKLDAHYQPGRRVEGWVKLKKEAENLDLVIVGAEYGTGKRTGFLSSFFLACRDRNNFLEIGKVSTGIKEVAEEGVTLNMITKILKPLIVKTEGRYVQLKPKIVMEVGYEEIQKSPTYSSGYALRFPRIIRLREDKPVKEIATLSDVKNLYRKQVK